MNNFEFVAWLICGLVFITLISWAFIDKEGFMGRFTPPPECYRHYKFADGTEDYCIYATGMYGSVNYWGCVSGREYRNAVNVVRYPDCLVNEE